MVKLWTFSQEGSSSEPTEPPLPTVLYFTAVPSFMGKSIPGQCMFVGLVVFSIKHYFIYDATAILSTWSHKCGYTIASTEGLTETYVAALGLTVT